MEYYMKEALIEANKAIEFDEVPIGAVIVYKDKIIARAFNGKERSQNATRHAEIIAIEEASNYLQTWRLDECDLYVTLEPCSMCAGAIIQARLRQVSFGTTDSKSGALGGLYNMYDIKGFNHYPVVNHGLLKDDCSTILKNYFKTKR